jgi:hypothetical protein
MSRLYGPGTITGSGVVADVVEQLDRSVRKSGVVQPVVQQATVAKKPFTVGLPSALTGTDATDIRNLHAKLNELIAALRAG